MTRSHAVALAILLALVCVFLQVRAVVAYFDLLARVQVIEDTRFTSKESDDIKARLNTANRRVDKAEDALEQHIKETEDK